MRVRSNSGARSYGSITGGHGSGGGGNPGSGTGGNPGGGGGNPGGDGAGVLEVYQDGVSANVVAVHFDRLVIGVAVVPDNSFLLNGQAMTGLVYASDGYAYFTWLGGPVTPGMVWTITNQPNWASSPIRFPQSGVAVL